MAFFRGTSDINAGLDYSIYLSSKGDVYSWGEDDYNVLGHNPIVTSESNYVSSPTLIKFFHERKLSIDRVVVGVRNWVAFFRTRDSKDWYCTGFGGLMGLRRSNRTRKIVTIIPHVFFNEREMEKPLREVIEIAPGGDFILFYVRDLKSGKLVVYEGGYKERCKPNADNADNGGFHDRFGEGRPPLSHILFFDDKQITKISCGAGHFFVFDAKGKIYCSGSNDSGQLGLGMEIRDEVSTVVEHTYFLKKGIGVKAIECTDKASFFITTGGKVFACGLEEYGELGLSISEMFSSIPLEIVSFRGLYIESAYCGRYTALFLTNTGDVWRTGREIEIKRSDHTERSKFSQALEDKLPHKVTIRLSDKEEKIERMAVGQDQLFIMTSCGCVYGGGVFYPESKHKKIHLLRSIARIDPIRSIGRFKRMLRGCTNYVDVVIRAGLNI